jgi:hypothetical protein
MVPCRVRAVRFADHAEQRFAARLAVDHPGGVEDLVPAVLRIGLREHHQLDVGRIAPARREQLDEVIDFVVRQRQPEPGVGFDQAARPPASRSTRSAARREVAEQVGGLREVVEHGLQHAVMEQGGDGRPLGRPTACGAASRR